MNSLLCGIIAGVIALLRIFSLQAAALRFFLVSCAQAAWSQVTGHAWSQLRTTLATATTTITTKTLHARQIKEIKDIIFDVNPPPPPTHTHLSPNAAEQLLDANRGVVQTSRVKSENVRQATW